MLLVYIRKTRVNFYNIIIIIIIIIIIHHCWTLH
jgi:hypothetical protein